MTRETIFKALFSLAVATPGLVTFERKVRHWTDVTPSEQPALFMGQGDEEANTAPGYPTKWTLWAHFYLYCNHASDPSELPATQINNIIDAIQTALKPSIVTGYNTLGGLVFDCRISGKIETDEGLLGDQSVAVIPVKILYEE